MTDAIASASMRCAAPGPIARRAADHGARRHRAAPVAVALLAASLGACSAPKRDWVGPYYSYDFVDAREAVRAKAAINDDDVILNNLRLGLASMADGDDRESERSLGTAFRLLSTAGLNKDRTTAATLFYEGIRIWKGEPFEQALAFYWTSAYYAQLGDWDNCRAAAANSIFRLTDFGRDMTQQQLVRKAAENDNYLDRGYNAVDTNFALGFLMQAIGADRTGAGGSKEQFDAALRIAPTLAPLVQTLRGRQYDTLLLVDFGRGPQKIATGPDDAIVEFRPRETIRGPLSVAANGQLLGAFPVVCDVDRMAQDHRWNNLEDVRKAKSLIGNVLLYGGMASTGIGAYNNSGAAVAAGLGAMAAGLLLKSMAAGDTRYIEYAPSSIYLVPLRLGGQVELRLQVGTTRSLVVLPQFQPGTLERPRAAYVRLLGAESPSPPWLTSIRIAYTNDATGVRNGDFPWVIGGGDVGTPTEARLADYQRGGQLAGWNVGQLRALYESLGILIGSGMENRQGQPIDPSYRHVLEGGIGLFTPRETSMGYKRIMFTPQPPYTRPTPTAPTAEPARRSPSGDLDP
ncbi:MAG: hypothetical protein U0575_05145 [Phycisphaerales bacterium]